MNEDLRIILNGKKVKGRSGDTVLELARRKGIEIPTLCHDPRIEPYSSCYLCVVEIDGYRGLQPSCSTKIAEGMTVQTHNDKISYARKTALDLLLSNHFADCVGPCKTTCPAGVDVQGYISYIDKGMYHEAVALIKETNPLPAICGRVCVRPCEVACRRNLLDEGAPVGIDYMKRFASDYDLESENKWKPQIEESTSRKVAVIGAGPGGLSAAFFLQKKGHQVDIFEAAPAAGGWLRYGIPEYRLPNDLLQKEVDNITEMGVNIFYNSKLGDNILYKDLKTQYDSVILTIGSQKGTLVGIEGEDAEGVFSGIDFLKEMEVSGEKFDFSGKKVVVVGGGNTAMDCCRTSIRCGAKEVYVVYRRTEKEMPANPIEIHESKLEGVIYLLLTNPTKVNKDNKGKVKSMTCLKMKLGEPDSSGRRRPIAVKGSEFELEVDYILAAIGQKTVVDFIDEVNSEHKKEELETNRWGDIDADPKTLQTGVKSIFAAGDGVTGPATLIEAIGAAKVAAKSCHQYLTGTAIEPEQKEFLSKRDNFKKQEQHDYVGHYEKQKREEMPTIDPGKRMNFHEVEKGYANEEVAIHEAQRCLECGCTEYFTCYLKKHATKYQAEQTGLKGDYKEYEVDFRHPYIEIDNNKCILCSRCIRICREVVGANALGLVNRGFDTYVAPAMGKALQDTTCESCGLCISTCPTAAITENFVFKPGPVELSEAKTICNYCSVGCEINLNHKNGFVMNVTGSNGKINSDRNICKSAKFGYKYLNNKSRITKPLYKVNGRFEEISYVKAFDIIHEKIRNVKADQNAFFAGARLTNEELYLVQKFARTAAKTNNVTSFHYLNRGKGFIIDVQANVPFDQLGGASKIYFIGSEINEDNPVVGFMVNEACIKNNIPLESITNHEDSSMLHKVNSYLQIKSYYHFIRAVNFYLVSNHFENKLFLDDNCYGYEDYKKELMKEDFMELVKESGVEYLDQIIEFAKNYNEEQNAVVIYSEKDISTDASSEIINMSFITGKHGKTSSGVIALKEKNNSQGIFDMGVCPFLGVGSQLVNEPKYIEKVSKKWKVKDLPSKVNSNLFKFLENGKLKNLFIFGEDPVGCSTNKVKVAGWLSIPDFVVVQDYFHTETTKFANLILPASLPMEIGGSFTNTQKIIQEFEKQFESKPVKTSIEQMMDLLALFGLEPNGSVKEVMMEAMSLLPMESKDKLSFMPSEGGKVRRMFNHGCDNLVKLFDEEFNNSFK